MIERLKADFIFNDERGTLTQLIHTGFSQINVITSKAGIIRGGHYHELNKEAFYIIQGKCLVTASRDGKTESCVFEAGDMFQISEYVIHDFEYLEDTVLVSMYSRGVELGDGKMDIITPNR